MSHKFQVHLRGIIELLSKHLYSGPHVYLRELLQNGVDAIRARVGVEPGHDGEITLEILGHGKKGQPTLLFTDNGIGLTEAEIHEFLATIGQSSKRGDDWDQPSDFIGRFGVGLLSCFIVSDEIVVLTRSARDPGARTLEWRGRQDGTYSIKVLERDIPLGSQVYLTCKPGSEEFFDPDKVRELAQNFGSLLPYPIRMLQGKDVRVINEERPPWRRRFANVNDERSAMLDYGEQAFGMRCFDFIPLRSETGQVDGVAYVLPHTPSLAARNAHRVYLKNMLLAENAEGLLPDWAFFVKCVVNANDLRPLASREGFYEDDALATARDNLGQCLRDYLVKLARQDPERLRRLVGLHYLAMKALATQDDEFFTLFIDFLPFETSLGVMNLAEYRKENATVRYVSSHDQFRQISGVAAAQGMCIVNGGTVYDRELLEKYGQLFPESSVEEVDPSSLTQALEDLSLEEQEEMFNLVRVADLVLQPYRCSAEIKKFLPREVPTLYSTSREGNFLRSVEQSQEVANELWAGVLGSLVEKRSAGLFAQLCFNYHNPLVRKLATLKDRTLLQRSIQMLYVQALMLGHHPLQAREMTLLNEGLIGLIEYCVK